MRLQQAAFTRTPGAQCTGPVASGMNVCENVCVLACKYNHCVNLHWPTIWNGHQQIASNWINKRFMCTVLCSVLLRDCDTGTASSQRAADDCGSVDSSLQIDGSVECCSPSQRKVLIGVGFCIQSPFVGQSYYEQHDWKQLGLVDGGASQRLANGEW